MTFIKKLIESVVEPVLFYCAGIWGNRRFPKVESVINKACRYFLGVSKNAPNLSSKGDMGWVSAEVKQKLETVRLWCRLRNMPAGRITQKIHLWSFNTGNSWENRMLKVIDSLGIRESMLAQNPSKVMCLKIAREKLIARDKQNWQNQLFDDRNGSENGNKLRTYRKYKNTLNPEQYVLTNMRRDHRRILAKFRSCNLPLAIETGRYTRPKTPLNDRLCKFCDGAAVEDETHFLVDCEFYSDIRYDLFHCANVLYSDFSSLSSGDKLIFLMQNNDLQRKLASTLVFMCRRRRFAAN